MIDNSTLVGERSIAISFSHCLFVCVCLSASISLELLDRSSQNLLCIFPVASDSGGPYGDALLMVLRYWGGV